MYLALFVLLCIPWVLNFEDLEQNIKDIWFDLSSAKENPSHNPTLDIFSQKASFIPWMTKQDKQTTSQVNTSWDF